MKERGTALITGATSGIGLEFARQLAAKGHHLVLTGRRMDILELESERLRKSFNVEVSLLKCDFTRDEDVLLVQKKLKEINQLDYLVNNAGFGHKGAFLEDIWDSQKTMLQVHINALTAFSHTAAVIMKKQGFGAIINVSSVASFTPSPTSPLYSSSKAYINSFSLSLDTALHPYGISVQSLCPGFTRTDFHSKLNMEESKLRSRGFIRWMKARDVVRLSLKNLSKSRVIYIPGFSNKILSLFARMLPYGLYRFISLKFFRKFKEGMK